MKKVLIVFGTRPEAIKMAPVIKEFQKYPDKFETVVCVTAQHREMLDQVLSIFEIKPDIDLNIMQKGQDLTDITSRVLIGIRKVINDINPDFVLVHGDTTTSMSTALAAYYKQLPIGHIEAGLRTHNIYCPWPEEVNRLFVDRIAVYHFAPTELNRKNLINEGISEKGIFVTGNTVIDALFMALEKIENEPGRIEKIDNELQLSGLPADRFALWDGDKGQRRMVLITGHRRENFGEGFINICEAIRDLATMHQDTDFVFPMHLNPNVREPIKIVFGTTMNENVKNIFFIEPVGYLPFIWLMKKCFLVLTDSGGIQEEAPSLKKPVILMRESTERPEAIEVGNVIPLGTKKNLIKDKISCLLTDDNYYKSITCGINPYGDGKSASRIVRQFLS